MNRVRLQHLDYSVETFASAPHAREAVVASQNLASFTILAVLDSIATATADLEARLADFSTLVPVCHQLLVAAYKAASNALVVENESCLVIVDACDVRQSILSCNFIRPLVVKF